MSTLSVLIPRALCVVALVLAGCETLPPTPEDGSTVDSATNPDLSHSVDSATHADLSGPDLTSPGDLSQPADLTGGVTCSGACPAGQYQVTGCTASSDRVCAACTTIAGCTTETCTTATDQSCTACNSGYYQQNGTCIACSGACADGTYETSACTGTADHVCSSCTSIASCAAELCTTATDQSCDTCDTGFYVSTGACLACSATCPAGTYQTAACSATMDLGCAMCTPLANCAAETCSGAGASVCTSCDAGFYLQGGTCHACSGSCPGGQTQSAACTATSDRACTSCTVISNCTAETCTTTSDQVCTACAGGFYLSGNACVACAATCGAGSFESQACGGTNNRVCTTCTPLAGCTAETCTNATNAICGSCTAGSYLQGGTCHACSGACATDEYMSAACSPTADRQCSTCTGLPNCSAESCTTAADSTCSSCSGSNYLSGGLCNACSPACTTGSFLAAACSPTTDRVCAACTASANCTAETCTTASDQVCTSCDGTSWLGTGTCHVCTTCSSNQYQNMNCTTVADRSCTNCSGVTSCSSGITCTSGSTSQCTSCSGGFYLVEGTVDTCATCSMCAPNEYLQTACGAADTVCSTCPTHCTTCTSATACTACDAGYAGTLCDIHTVGQYRLDEISGTTLVDSSGPGHDGALFSGIARDAGPNCHSGKCLVPGTGNAQIPITSDTKFGTKDFTVAFWAKTTSAGGQEVMFSNIICGEANGFLVSEINGNIGFGTFGAGSLNTYMLSTSIFTDGVWHFVAVERSGASILLFVDGNQEASQAIDAAWDSDAPTSTDFWFGDLAGGCAGTNFNGSVDELTISRGALDATALGNLMNQPVSFRDDFDRLQRNGMGTQCDTNDPVYAFSTISGWNQSGPNAVHAVEHALDDIAISFYFANQIELNEAVLLNDLGKQYTVAFDVGPAVWNGCSQATRNGEGVQVEVFDNANAVIDSRTFNPGAWTGTQSFSTASYSYTGTGTGPVRFRIYSTSSNGFFGAAVDNFTVTPN